MNLDDLPLFAKPKIELPARENNPDRENLRLKAAAWIGSHPKAAALLLRFARELAGRGRRFGIGLLTERLRWEATVEGWGGEGFKINNNYRAYIARWLIAQDKAIEEFIQFREVHW